MNPLPTENSDIASIIAEFRAQQALYEAKFKGNGGLIGVSSGYDKLDDVIDGLRPEHLWIVGGYTNVGKTFAALNIAVNLIRQGKRVVIYSLEMARLDVLSRLLGILTNQNGTAILKAYKHDTQAVEKAFELLVKSDLVIHTLKNDLTDIWRSMKTENEKKPVDLFVIDFLQIVTVKDSKTEYETVTTAVLRLQQVAKLLKCPIMALSQISNDGARNQEQEVMTFKGSGAIAAAADLAIEIQRYKGESKEDYFRKIKAGEPISMTWLVRKNRHGRTGAIDMSFDGRTGIFKLSDFEKI